MSKAAEFEALANRKHFLHRRTDGIPGEFQRALSAFNAFCGENSDLILRALRRDERLEHIAGDEKTAYKVAENFNRTQHGPRSYSPPSVEDVDLFAVQMVLVAFREAVK